MTTYRYIHKDGRGGRGSMSHHAVQDALGKTEADIVIDDMDYQEPWRPQCFMDKNGNTVYGPSGEYETADIFDKDGALVGTLSKVDEHYLAEFA